MSLLSDRLQGLIVTQKEQRSCALGKYLTRLEHEEPEAATLLNKILDMPHISIRSIKHELDAAGQRIARETISAHRRGVCVCGMEQS